MTISGAGSLYSSGTDSTTSIAALLAQDANGGTSSADGTSSTTASASAHISGPGKLMAKLQQLQQTDPTKFKQVMSDMAAKLNALAQQQSGTSSAGGSGPSLTELANKFSSAAQSGDLSAFQPPSATGGTSAANAANAYAQNSGSGSTVSGHHHHHHGGSAPASGTSGSDASDGSGASTAQDPLAALFSQLSQDVSGALQTASGTSGLNATSDVFSLPSQQAV